jgi:hypothetical protein
MNTPLASLIALCLVSSALPSRGAPPKDPGRPFILWTKEEAAAIKKRIDSDPAAKEQLDRMIARDSKDGAKAGGNVGLLNLFKYSVLGDAKAGDIEKAKLLEFIGKVPEPLTEEFKTKVAALIAEAGGDEDKIWQRGMASFADRHMRDEQTANALRYDVLYDLLTPEERAGVEKTMRGYIQFHLDGHRPWHPDFKYTKAGWLPNMSWPRAIGTHALAVALKDEKLIEAMFNSLGGWKWYFDDYISDGRFYNEEFGKYYSNTYTMLLYCEGLERLGLSRFGYGYTGTDHGSGGATMQRYLKMFFDLGYPRVDIPGGMPSYQHVMMGDAKGPPFGMEGFGGRHTIQGFLPNGTGGNPAWGVWNMNGPFTKGLAPIWFEIGHRRFPKDSFDYFLAAMRKPGETLYHPSLYFGLGPIDPKTTTPPPAPSYLAPQRQFALLRAEETPAFWESAAPAVGLQFAGYYPHYAHDSFTLLGFYALNRPIYTNAYGAPVDHYVHPQIKNGPPTGYIARHPWKDTNRGHSSVTVDNLGPRPVNSGENGLEKHATRFDSTPTAKFVAGRAQEVFPGVEQERALLLTRDYLFDLFWVADTSGKKRRFEWSVLGMGSPLLDDSFQPSSDLNGSMLYRPLPWQGPEVDVTEEEKANIAQPPGYEDKTDANDLTKVRKLVADDKEWSAGILQTCALEDVSKSKLGAAFYDRKVGVRVSMLPEKGTVIYAGNAPQPTATTGGGAATIRAGSEVGGACLLVRRELPTTTFVALHEPFENGTPRPLKITRLAQTDGAVAVSIRGGNVDDRVAVAYSPGADKPVTLALDESGSITFTSHAHVAITKDSVAISGNVTALQLKVKGTPKVTLNGKPATATTTGGMLVLKAP